MAHIHIIEEAEAQGTLRDVYRQIRSKRGPISNMLKISSVNPDALKAHLELFLVAMHGPSPLTRTEREMIAVVVSSASRCQYCTHHHGEALRRLRVEADVIEALKRDYVDARLDPKHLALLSYAQKLATMPWKISAEDVEELKRVGYDERAIHDAALVASYFAFAIRLGDGLGVEMERDRQRKTEA